MLVRDYLRKILYDTQKGYFSKSSPIMMNESKSVVDFTKLQGKNEWIKVQSELFLSKQKSGEWLTQSELFAPYFSSVLVDFVARNDPNARKGLGLNVFEIGGGSGTNALNFLDTLKARYPELYAKSKYTLCEISPTMAGIQLSRVSGRHSQVCEVKNVDFLKWDTVIQDPSVVIAMEVLDNLPHDKLMYTGPEKTLPQLTETNLNDWQEVMVEEWGLEASRPLTDPLALETAKLFLSPARPTPTISSFSWNSFVDTAKRKATQFTRSRAERNAKSVFVPSGSVAFLKVIQRYFPRHLLVAGDFSFLPFGEVSGSSQNLRAPGSLFGCKNAPIVSGNDSKTGVRMDFASYILPGQNVDVFFQTDFDRLANAYRTIVNGSCDVKTTQAFLGENIKDTDRKLTTTVSGYNPLLQDFENVSFLVARRE